MTGTVALRATTAADLETILRHRRSMFEAMGDWEPAALDTMTAASRGFFARKLAEGAYRGFLVIGADGRVLAGGGIVFLDYQPHPRDPNGRRGFVVNMWTEPDQRRRGLARRLLEAMIESARGEAMQALYLHASLEGRPLYAQLGFVDNNEMRLNLRP